MSVLLVLIGLAVFCVGVFAGLRGHLSWARLPNRRRAVVLRWWALLCSWQGAPSPSRSSR